MQVTRSQTTRRDDHVDEAAPEQPYAGFIAPQIRAQKNLWLQPDEFFTTDASTGIDTPGRCLRAQPTMPAYVSPSTPGATATNNLVFGSPCLAITNYDRTPPTGYTQNGYSRQPWNTQQNKKALVSTNDGPRMPDLRVECMVAGFDPATTPIHWDLTTCHLLCRFSRNRAPVDHNAYYHPHLFPFRSTWRGTARAADFTLFPSQPSEGSSNVVQSSGWQPGFVLGGEAILKVWVEVGNGLVLQDYVHLRIVGHTMVEAHWLSHLRSLVADLQNDEQKQGVLNIAAAVMSHESEAGQFAFHAGHDDGVQSRTHINLKTAGIACHHGTTSADGCELYFAYPQDPDGFPRVAFDCGFGMSQLTYFEDDNQGLALEQWSQVAWNYRESINGGMAILFRSLNAHSEDADTWLELARAALPSYNPKSTYSKLVLGDDPDSAPNDYASQVHNASGKPGKLELTIPTVSAPR